MPAPHDEEISYRRRIDSKLLGRMLRMVRPYRGRLAAAVALLIALSGAELLFPLLMKTGIDRYIRTGDLGGLTWISIAYLVLLGLWVTVLRWYF